MSIAAEPSLRKYRYIPIRDAIASHARPLIKRLAEKIHAEFGCSVKIGCEKECNINTVDEACANNNEDAYQRRINLSSDINEFRKSEEIAFLMQTGRRFYSSSQVLEDFHAETKLGKFEFKTPPTDPIRALERINAQCQRVSQYFSPMLDYCPYRNSECTDSDPFITAGLHVNFSVWYEDESGNSHNLCFAPVTLQGEQASFYYELKEVGKDFSLDRYMQA